MWYGGSVEIFWLNEEPFVGKRMGVSDNQAALVFDDHIRGC
jgi:hypothetical protein